MFDEVTLHRIKRLEDKYGNLICKKRDKQTIIFTDEWTGNAQNRRLKEDELLAGELSATIYTVGCYYVRSAKRVYMIPEGNLGYNPENEIPADADYLKKIKERESMLGIFLPDSAHRITHEISARHENDLNEVFANGFRYICRAAEARNLFWVERIRCIFTVKERLLPDESASLFVCNQHTGNSFSSDTWYELNSQGLISEFNVHPYA